MTQKTNQTATPTIEEIVGEFFERNDCIMCYGKEYKQRDRLTQILTTERARAEGEKRALVETERQRAVNIVIEEHYKLEEWFASAERPRDITHFDASQKTIATRNAITKSINTTPTTV